MRALSSGSHLSKTCLRLQRFLVLALPGGRRQGIWPVAGSGFRLGLRPPGVDDDLLLQQGVHITRGSNRIIPDSLVVISPGIRPSSSLFQNAHQVASEVVSDQVIARLAPVPIIGVTGTDGRARSPPGQLILAVARAFQWEWVEPGTPMLEVLGRAAPMDVAVIELSAFQLLTTTTLVPAIAVVTNVVDDHLDYFEGNAVRYRASADLVELAGAGCSRIAARKPLWSPPSPSSRPFCLRKPLGWLLCSSEGVHLELNLGSSRELPLPGHHTIINAGMVAQIGGSRIRTKSSDEPFDLPRFTSSNGKLPSSVDARCTTTPRRPRLMRPLQPYAAPTGYDRVDRRKRQR